MARLSVIRYQREDEIHMALSTLQTELERTGRKLSRWQAELKGAFWTAVVLGCLLSFGLYDVFIRFERLGRVATWVVLLILISTAFSRIWKTLSQPHTVQGVAATIEKSFPRLDNHLINYIQFSANKNRDVFKEAYVARGVPEWREINPDEMKDRRAHLRANLAFIAAAVLLIAPLAITGQTWAVALWRIINPFSNVEPISLTHIISVEPGDASVTQGSPFVMECKVQGRKGHEVWLDIKPADDEKTTYSLGKISGADKQNFPHRIPKVAAETKYRFRAGDAPAPKWYTVQIRPPLAFTRIGLKIRPPDYTRISPKDYEAMGDEVQIPQGSTVDATIKCNLSLKSASLTMLGETVQFAQAGSPDTWKATFTVKDAGIMRFAAADSYGEEIEFAVNFRLLADRLPKIEILAPQGRPILPAGATPRIQLVINDDYGLTDVSVERVEVGILKDSASKVLESWSVERKKEFEQIWEGKNIEARPGETLAFRIVAKDNYPLGEHVTKSAVVTFDNVSVDKAEEKKKGENAKVADALGRLIELQRQNVDVTDKLKKAIDVSKPEQWTQVTERQKEIRQLAAIVLKNPLKPLGAQTLTFTKLYMEEMVEVITTLARVNQTEGSEKLFSADRSLMLEERILRRLTYADIAAKQTQQKREVTSLITMLEDLIKDETTVVNETQVYIQQRAKVSSTLVNKQDNVADDLAEFVLACRNSVNVLEATDKTFAGLIVNIADECDARRIKADMLKAAEKLESNEPAEAEPPETVALNNLKELYGMMKKWQINDMEEKEKQILDALQDAKEDLKKIRELTAKVIEAERVIDSAKNKDDKETDLMEDELDEMKKNTKEALLEIGKDLHIFQELSVANELVEDVTSVFEEINQTKGSEKMDGKDIESFGMVKLEILLDLMKKAEDRTDAVEMWLEQAPDRDKLDMEAFDPEEMPKMSLGALSAAAEDLVGDLLKEQEDAAKKADDSASNQGVPDVPLPGWGAVEGDQSSFAAQGKSGNQTPDHKEQDGRGNVGRQGMANGETAAGSGTIGEGDKNIEKRRTQDPTQSGQVQVDGEADENATGGGKQASGSADEVGMQKEGATRMDGTGRGSWESIQAMLAKQAQGLYVKASLLNLRTESLSDAAHHMRQAEDAIAEGLPIYQVREFQKRAIMALKQAKAELGGTDFSAALDNASQSTALEDAVEGGTDQAPEKYRDLVAEYFKSLNKSL